MSNKTHFLILMLSYFLTGGFPLLDYDPSIPVSDMDVNIDCILKKIPNRDSKTESELVGLSLVL